jgi:hypothetical protein
MAKSRAKGKEQQTIAVTVERGRLVPVSPYDLELLSQWRDGAILNIEPVLAQTRPKERQYFAMLTQLLKVAETPWSNVLTAHEELKKATGFITPMMKNGVWKTESRHIATFTDRELEEYYELFCGIVRTRFGIDPDTLRKEAPNTESPGAEASLTAAEVDAPDADPIPVGVGVPETEEDSENESSSNGPSADGEPEAGDGIGSIPRDPLPARGGLDHPLTDADLDWLKVAARMLVAATAQGGGVEESRIIDRQVLGIKSLTGPTISAKAKGIAQQIYKHCIKACVDNRPLDKEWIAAMAGCRVSDLRPEAR